MKKSLLVIIVTLLSTVMLLPVPVTASQTVTAIPTTSKVLIDGDEINVEAYLINDNNYFKLRDLANALSGTQKQFNVVWDNKSKHINLVSNAPYSPVGGEMQKGDKIKRSATINTSSVYIDGSELSLTSYNVNGNNYFKLRDIGKTFNFEVGWNSDTKIISINTSNAYSEPLTDKEITVKPPTTYTPDTAPRGMELVCIGYDENWEPVLVTIEEWERMHSKEYLLATGESFARTSYEQSEKYQVSDHCPKDSYNWSAVRFWWEPVGWTEADMRTNYYKLGMDYTSTYFEWELYCDNPSYDGAKGNVLKYIPCPTYEESYNLYNGGEFKFGLAECDKYKLTTLYIRKI